MTYDLTALGHDVADVDDLDTFTKPAHCTFVTLEVLEGTSLCPVTGQPDFWTVTIKYAPRDLCVETKSLKLWLRQFREEGHFAEELAGIIAEEVMKATNATTIETILRFTTRGGMDIVAEAKL